MDAVSHKLHYSQVPMHISKFNELVATVLRFYVFLNAFYTKVMVRNLNIQYINAVNFSYTATVLISQRFKTKSPRFVFLYSTQIPSNCLDLKIAAKQLSALTAATISAATNFKQPPTIFLFPT